MNDPRADQTATMLASGKVLITGEVTGSGVVDSAELYDPAKLPQSQADIGKKVPVQGKKVVSK
jgi:hypothetical protein